MVPIHDTDVAEKRWTDDEWRQFELWEKIELRLRRRKHVWIAITAALFLLLSSVPIALEMWPKWVGLHVSRQIAQEVNRLRGRAILEAGAQRIAFSTDAGLNYQIERAENCSSPAELWKPVKSGGFLRSKLGRSIAERFRVLDVDSGRALGVPSLVHQICFDAIHGFSGVTPPGQAQAQASKALGVAVARQIDIDEKRLDRVSVVLLTGNSAEVDFE